MKLNGVHTQLSDPQWLQLERYRQRIDLLGEMLAKYLRDEPGATAEQRAAYEKTTTLEIWGGHGQD